MSFLYRKLPGVSVKAINWALELELPPAKKLILVVLADYADDSGYSFPGADKIASRSSISKRTLTRALAELEEDGYLVRERRNLVNGNRTSDGYRLTPSGTDSPAPQETRRQNGALTRRQNEGDKTPTVASTGEPSVEPPVNTTQRASQMPHGMTWGNEHSMKAHAKGVDVEVEFAKFTDYHLSKGSKFVDWSRAFHTWLNNARPEPGFGKRPDPPRQSREQEISSILNGRLGLDGMEGITS